MEARLQNIVPSSSGSYKGKEPVPAIAAGEENYFEQRFEKDLETYRQKERLADSRPAERNERDEDEEHLSEAPGLTEKTVQDRNEKKPEESGLKEDGSKQVMGQQKTGADDKQAQQENEENGKGQNTGSQETSGTDKTSKNGETAEAPKNPLKPEISAGFEILQHSAVTTSTAPAQSAAGEGSGKGKGSVQGQPVTTKPSGILSSQPGGAESTKLSAVKQSGSPAKSADTTGVTTNAETSLKSTGKAEAVVIPQDTQKSAAPDTGKTKNGMVLVPGADKNKNEQAPRKAPELTFRTGTEDESQNVKQHYLGSERRPAKVKAPVDRAEFLRMTPPDKQARQGAAPESLLSKVQVTEPKVKVGSGDASTANNGEQSKEFKTSANTIHTADNSVSAKKEVVQKLVNLVRQQQVRKGRQTEVWQRHRFVTDDGKAIHVASKSAEGLLTLQLGTQNQDLNKMLQQHLQEIRAHLQEQFGMEIDVQLQNQGQQADAEAQESGDGPVGNAGLSETQGEPLHEGQDIRIKRLGFNTNEWIA